jgi:hypothetical protein
MQQYKEGYPVDYAGFANILLSSNIWLFINYYIKIFCKPLYIQKKKTNKYYFKHFIFQIIKIASWAKLNRFNKDL